MATIGDAMVTLLTDNWAGAGAAPTFGHLVDYQKDLVETEEQVIVRLPIHEDVTPINDTYSNFKYTIQLRVKSTVSDDRLKVLADETIRIINSYAITGITRQFAKRGENTSDRKRQIFSYDVWAWLEEHVSAGGTSYSSPGAGDVVFPADVEIKGNLTRDAAGAALISFKSTDATSSIILDAATGFDAGIYLKEATVSRGAVVYDTSTNRMRYYSYGANAEITLTDDGKINFINVTDGTITLAQIADLLMFGSANAAWVPCSYTGDSSVKFRVDSTSGSIENIDGTGSDLRYDLPLPTTKGALKLYISGTRVVVLDADAAAFVDNTTIYGYIHTGVTSLNVDPTNYDSQDVWDDTFAAVDCSSYNGVFMWIACDVDAVDELNIHGAFARCYYAA